MIKRILLVGLASVGVVVLVQAFYGGRPGDVAPKESFEVLAHRGVHTNWKKGTYDRASGCEAAHIYTPTHDYLENTIEAIGAAFDLGATMVEIDVRRSSDDHLVIFHDWMLECRTDGQGNVSDHPLVYLQSLDIGYGYTHDGGHTYPFRGKGVGKMPTLVEVLEAYPAHRFLIDHKDGSMETATLLVEVLQGLPDEQPALLSYWGPDETYEYIRQKIPTITRTLAIRPHAKSCLMPYLLTLGLAGFPGECEGLGLAWPVDYRWIAWGWPYRFLDRLSDAGVRFYLMVDTEKDARAFADLPVDGIVTDYIEVVGRYYNREH